MYDGKKYFELRSWMYTHRDYAGRVTNAFLNGLETLCIKRVVHRSHR